LTTPIAKAYIRPLDAPPLLNRRDGASAKPLTVYTVNHPAMTYGHDGCAGFGGFGSCRSTELEGSGLFEK
jgi:hypothetical protein